MKLKSESREALLAAQDYREFLRLALSLEKKRINFAAFSRRAGFSSRSFPRDVVFGKRRITASSLPQFISGLEFRGDWKAYFETLVALEEPLAVPSLRRVAGSEKVRARLKQIRSRLQRNPIEASQSSKLFRSYERWLEVYAALGSQAHGNTLEGIASKSKCGAETCQRILEEMKAHSLVRWDEETQRYFPTQTQLVMSEMGLDEFAKRYYLSSIADARKQAQASYHSDQRLFLCSVFSMNSSRAPEFKKQLRALMEKFFDQAEDPDGDSIAKVVVAFGPN